MEFDGESVARVRGETLRLLEEARREPHTGSWVSGERIAERLGVSRAAVWKAISALRAEGYEVDAVPRRGYSLVGPDDILTRDGIRASLSPDSTVRRVICLDVVDSTNNYAKGLLLHPSEGGTQIENGTLIVANRQTAGRGRHGHSFVSPSGTGLYMSLILRPTVELEHFQLITIAAAVAVCQTLEALPHARGGVSRGLSPLVKWVNDIFLRGEDGQERKVCGILSEAVTSVESGEIEGVVVGIGLNLTTREFGEGLDGIAGSVFPPGMEPTAGRARVAAEIAERLMSFAEKLAASESEDLIHAYRERSLLLGREISYFEGTEQKRGRAVEIDERGGLVVEEGGKRTTLRSGEVHEIRPVEEK